MINNIMEIFIGGDQMKGLSDVETISLATILKMESDGLVLQRAMNNLISDEDLKRQSEASILATEGRIKGIQQFLKDNNISVAKED